MNHECRDCGHTWLSTPPTPPRQPSPPTDDTTPADWLRQNWDWPTELTAAGWTHARGQGDQTYWTRPGKNPRDGHSAVLHGTDGPLVIFTTDIPNSLNAATTTRDGSGICPTPLEWHAAHHHNGDLGAAARALRQQMPRNTPQRPSAAPTATPPANVDPNTGEILHDNTDDGGHDWRNLPETFWNARPSLTHIRQAAHHRVVSADAVLAVVLARTACLIHPSIQLPPIVGGRGSLNFAAAIVAQSGGGKTAAKAVATDLIPLNHRTDIRDNVTPGSGEGLIEAFLEFVDDDDGKGKVKRQTRMSCFVFADEGQALIQLGERNGSTILTTLRTAWSGGELGTQNASQETNRRLQEHRYRLGIVVGFQLTYAATLIADGEGGTPQRFMFAHAVDPTIPDTPPEWPGALHIDTPPGVTGEQLINVDECVAQQVFVEHRDTARGTRTVNPLDSHANLGRLKIAALLAVLDGRPLELTAADWDLAGVVMQTSRAVRQWAIEHAAASERQQAEARTAAAINKEAAIDADKAARALEAGARQLARKVHSEGGTVSHRTASRAISGRHREWVTVDAMTGEAVARKWVTQVEGGWSAGPVKP